MRPKSMPEFAKQMEKYFNIKNSNQYLDTILMQMTNRLELNIFKLDDFLHEEYGDYERLNKSMSDIILEKYGKEANLFIDSMLG